MNKMLKRSVTKKVTKKAGPVGRLADVAILGGTALRYAQRKGWIDEKTATKLGAKDSSAGESVSVSELLILAGAVWRIVRSLLKHRSARRL